MTTRGEPCRLASVLPWLLLTATPAADAVAMQDVEGALRAATVAQQHGAGSAGASAKTGADEKPERKWVTHTIIPGERYEDLQARYRVSKGEIIRWNRKRLGEKKWLFAGRKLRIYARRVPPPRRRTRYVVQFGDTWREIADKFDVPVEALRHWNKKVPTRFQAGTVLTVWTNPPPSPEPDEAGDDSVVPDFQVRPGGYAVGKPNRGRLRNGVRLPKSELYTIRNPDQAWGTSNLILQVQAAIAEFRHETGYEGEIEIGAISRRGGGRLRPHKSHQCGRDIDVRLPKLPGASGNHIDWGASWELVEAFLDTDQVEYIFLSYRRQRRLYRAARARGVSDGTLSRVFQFPKGPRSNNGIIRHARGHIMHIHVRIQCSPEASRCKSY